MNTTKGARNPHVNIEKHNYITRNMTMIKSLKCTKNVHQLISNAQLAHGSWGINCITASGILAMSNNRPKKPQKFGNRLQSADDSHKIGKGQWNRTHNNKLQIRPYVQIVLNIDQCLCGFNTIPFTLRKTFPIPYLRIITNIIERGTKSISKIWKLRKRGFNFIN